MAEKRQKTHSVLLRTEGKAPVPLELFAARLWPDQAGAEGLFRVRIDDVWHCVTASDKYSFLSLTAVGELAARILSGADISPEIAPHLPYRAKVLAHVSGELLPQSGSVQAPPHQEADGRWWVWVWIAGRGPTRLPCTDVKLIRL